jgi:hypothetical protein
LAIIAARPSIRVAMHALKKRKDKTMRVLFAIWGFFGFLICGFVTVLAINLNAAALMAMPTVILMWIGGMFLFGLAAMLNYQEWKQT